MTARVPGGAIGNSFQSYLCPLSWWNADFVGSILYLRRMFSVVAAWFSNWSHNWVGHWLSVEHKPLMKWFLNVWMARLAALTQWLACSTNCHLQCFERRYFLRGVTAWLSVTFKVSLCPFSVNSVKTLSNASSPKRPCVAIELMECLFFLIYPGFAENV